MCQIPIIEKETRIINTVHFFTKDFLRIAQMNSFVNVFPYDEKKPCSVETSQYLDLLRE